MNILERNTSGVLVRFANESEFEKYVSSYKEEVSGVETDKNIEENFNNSHIRVFLSNGRSLSGTARFGRENIFLDSGLHQAIIRKSQVISIVRED